MLAAETSQAMSHSAGWFLEHAWVIPIIPAVAFALIISLRFIQTRTLQRSQSHRLSCGQGLAMFVLMGKYQVALFPHETELV